MKLKTNGSKELLSRLCFLSFVSHVFQYPYYHTVCQKKIKRVLVHSVPNAARQKHPDVLLHLVAFLQCSPACFSDPQFSTQRKICHMDRATERTQKDDSSSVSNTIHFFCDSCIMNTLIFYCCAKLSGWERPQPRF